MNDSPAPAFSLRGVLALVVLGALAFLVLGWAMGAGLDGGSTNDGGSHAGGKGLNGYAAFADFAGRRGYAVRKSRSVAALDDPGLLVLTPTQFATGEELEKIVSARHRIGPTLIVLPKWMAGALPSGTPDAQRGWVALGGAMAPDWRSFRDSISVGIAPLGRQARWVSGDLAGPLPRADAVLSGSGGGLVPLVTDATDQRVLAAYLADGGIYPGLDAMAGARPEAHGDDGDLKPLVLVFEPDLLDNYGMASLANARLADRLLAAATAGGPRTVTFDLTLNGLGRSANLLTLAFTPPFLAATLCLLMAALAAGWRAFLRFGPARREGRALAFGKQALVANTAGLIARAGRLHLVAAPYADAARERLAHALALPRMTSAEPAEAAIDRALANRTPDGQRFSTLAARLRRARTSHDILRAARELHALERTLTP